MSSKKYIETQMSDRQRDIMWGLFMKGTNCNGRLWVTFGDVEDAVADLLKDERTIIATIKYSDEMPEFVEASEPHGALIDRTAFVKLLDAYIDRMIDQVGNPAFINGLRQVRKQLMAVDVIVPETEEFT